MMGLNKVRNNTSDTYHYNGGRNIEPITYLQSLGRPMLGTPIKYISRMYRKDCPLKDIEKCISYLEFEIDFISRIEDFYCRISSGSVISDWRLNNNLGQALSLYHHGTLIGNDGDIESQLEYYKKALSFSEMERDRIRLFYDE